MHSAHDRDIESQIYHDSYRKVNPANFNQNHIECKAEYNPLDNLSDSKRFVAIGENRNYLEQNYRQTYLKCSKSEEYEFKFAKRQNNDFVSNYQNSRENELMTFESLKIENLSSNISITVNYENRTENTLHPKMLVKSQKDSDQTNNLKNLEVDEKQSCADMEFQKKIQPSTDSKNSFKNEYQSNTRSANPVFFPHYGYNDGNIRNNNGSNNTTAIDNDNIKLRDNTNFSNRNNSSNNQIYNSKYFKTGFCNNRNDNINVKDSNNIEYDIQKSNRRNETFGCVNPYIKNENSSEYLLPTNTNIVPVPQCHSDIKQNLYNVRRTDYDKSSYNQNVNNSCFNTFHARYPDISINLPDCKVQTIKHGTETTEKMIHNDKYIKEFPHSQIDNTLATISPKIIKRETDNVSDHFSIRSNFSNECVEKLNNETNFNTSGIGLKNCSNVIRSNPNFRNYSELSSKNSYEATTTLPTNFNGVQNACDTYEVYSNDYYNKTHFQENKNFRTDNCEVRNNKTNVEYNQEINSHKACKRSGTDCEKFNVLSAKSNSSHVNLQLSEQFHKSRQPYVSSNIYETKLGFNSAIRDNFKSYSSPYPTYQNSVNYPKSSSSSLAIPTSPSFIPSNSHEKYTNTNDNSNNLKHSYAVTQYEPQIIENSPSPHKIVFPNATNSEQNSLKCTIRWSGERNQNNINKKMNNLGRQNENFGKNNSKVLKKSDRISDAPNYRELLNKAYALKNTMSEKDLNLQIIRRTLKCEVPSKIEYDRSCTNPFQVSKGTEIAKNNTVKSSSYPQQNCFSHSNNITEIKSSHIFTKHKTEIKKEKSNSDATLQSNFKKTVQISKPVDKNFRNFNQQQTPDKHLSKNIQSPLDLSKKTIKNFADSTAETECSNSQIYGSCVNNFPTLPKIDFHPNFSIASIPVPDKKLSKDIILDLSEQKISETKINKNNAVLISQKINNNSVPNIDVHINIKSTSSNTKNYLPCNEFLSENQYSETLHKSQETTLRNKNIAEGCKAVDLTSKSCFEQAHVKQEKWDDMNIVPRTQFQNNIKNPFSKEYMNFSSLTHNDVPIMSKTETLFKPIKLAQLNSESNLKSDSSVFSNYNMKEIKPFENILKDNSASCYSQPNLPETKYEVKLDNVLKNFLKTKDDTVIKLEPTRDDVKENKCDIDSLRIRTKAELKGFDLTMLQSSRNEKEKEDVKKSCNNIDKNGSDLSTDIDLNLVDWNSKCNDFVTQLVSNSNKKPDIFDSEINQHKKDLLNEKHKSLKERKKKSNANDSNLKLSSSSDEDKPLKKSFNNIDKSIPLLLNEQTNTKLECRVNDLNIYESKTEKLYKKKKKLIIEKINQESDIDTDTNNCKNKNFESYLDSKQDDNDSLINANSFDPNKIGFFEIKTRKRKFVNSIITTNENQQEKQNFEQHKKINVMTKAEMKFTDKDNTSKTKICNDVTVESTKECIPKTNLKKKETISNIETNEKGSHEKCANSKINRLSNSRECARNKKRKMLLRNMEYNRILRNKRMITRGNLKKSLCNSVKKSKSLIRNKKNIKNSTLTKKFSDIKTKKNQKRITRASTKNENTSINSNKKQNLRITKSYKSDSNIQSTKGKLSNTKCNVSKFPPGWENDVFEFKKSLKIPLSLITVHGGKELRSVSTLPSEENKSCVVNKIKIEEDDQSNNSNSQISSKSIIDILHSRAINLNKEPKRLSKGSVNYKAKSEKNFFNKKSTDNSNKTNSNHFSVFDTEILKARTRTESRLLKTKEHIREIFVGEDRPASAPPEMPAVITKSDGNKTSFEEKFKQYLEEMNADFDIRIRKAEKIDPNLKSENESMNIKTENEQYVQMLKHEECSQQSLILKEEIVGEEDVKASIVSDVLHFGQNCLTANRIYKQKRTNKYRKKGSSGFDYIKKKKKITTSKPTNVFVRKQIFPKFFGKKTENDVCKEIKYWVINKSLGQSYLHKAARLGYLDVIAYCLERLNMDPDPKDNAGYTPLHEACQQGRIDIARLLLQYGANHSQAALSGIRPLHEASETGYIEIMRLLLSYGADPLLTTYAGQTPLMLADTDEIEQFILNHIEDIQNNSQIRKPWTLCGPWKICDADEFGYNELEDAPNCKSEQLHRVKHFHSISRNLKLKLMETASLNLHEKSDKNTTIGELVANPFCADDKEDLFEFEESEMPLPPLYILKDEGAEKWLLLSDLCHILKIKSKETLLKQIVSSAPSTIGTKDLLRELKITEFLEKATCLQLLCTGEKLNIQASKVVLIKYNDQVKSLLGVENTILNF